jgi:hypothetical protein
MRITCEACEDGTVWVSHHGGNDPNVWAVGCMECYGRGTVTATCEACDEPADLAYQQHGRTHYWCDECYKDCCS